MAHLTHDAQHQRLSLSAFPYIILSLWQGALLACSNAQTSLMAHDEGWYATFALGMVRSGDWLTPRWWGSIVYDKTSGLHWLIAAAYSLFGVNETVARIPSFIACVGSVCLLYAIGSVLINRVAALLGALSLSTVILWTQYGQLATQDMPLVVIELTCIWALLQAEHHLRSRMIWGFLAGLCLGLGFFVKGFMVVLPAIALLPYLIVSRRQHHHWSNPGLYAGLFTGLGLLALWFWRLWTLHGAMPFQGIFGMLLVTARQDYHRVGPWYYLWNVSANLLPWTPLAIAGIILLLRTSTLQRKWLTLGYPAVLILQLQLFTTKTLYYPLQIYPFLALYVGVALATGCQHWLKSGRHRALIPRYVSYGYGILGGLGCVLGLGLLLTWLTPLDPLASVLSGDLQQYGLPALAVGVSWLISLRLWLRSKRYGTDQTQYRWLAALLIGPWLAISLAGLTGLLGKYDPEVKAFCQQSAIATILQHHPIDFVVTGDISREDHKTWILTTFYTPQWGQLFNSAQEISPQHYAWVNPGAQPTLSPQDEQIGQVRNWLLIKKQF